MKRVCDSIASHIVARSGREREYVEVISYGLQCVLGTTAEFVSVALAGLLLGIFREVVVVSTAFALVRVVSGGVHFSTYWRCFVSGLVLFTAGGYISRYLWSSQLGWIYLTAGVLWTAYALWRYVPKDNPNRVIKAEEVPKFRRLSFTLAGILLLFMIVSCIIKGRPGWYHYSMVTGMVLQGFSLTEWGYCAVNYLDRLLDKKGGAEDEKA